MKNFRHGKWAIFPLADFHFIRIFRIMKLTFIMIFAFTLFAKADGIAQRVTVSVHNEGIEEVFAQISRQTDYKFFYDAIIPGENSRITLNVKNEPIESVLKKRSTIHLMNSRYCLGLYSYLVERNTMLLKQLGGNDKFQEL